ncbi:hypothetical protein N0V93_000680 [Gnomoniopsis smithogilvyi]|uniref:DNA replication checkpoint mediator MRC1 domain-containing protein n=1 Tax=Gnomoniopsis smithogilvyi TaxID=1191159 RepID=A0A9W8Z067_9PEZI|nr:hypothetical protein N0V93_000680 [Gnomoniopsis smithogilvyi]
MASSQPSTSSPARSAASPDRFALSPQARLKKLLATVDSDSDENEPKTKITKQKLPRQASPSNKRDNDASSHASDDEADVPRPRGRLAARMQGGASEDTDNVRERVKKLLQSTPKPDVEMTGTNERADSDDEDDVLRPRGRLAARMMGQDETAKASTEEQVRISPSELTAPKQHAEDAGDIRMMDDDEDEDIPVRRRFKQRQRQNQTPEPTTITPQDASSPGLFVTPSKSPPSAQESPAAESDSDMDMPALKSDRFAALVEKKRKERLAREAEEEEKRKARTAALEELDDDKDDDVSDITDDEGGRQLTQRQKGRPSRKASKKAIEEMNRETQRMQRSMQLAHEAKTKKKIAKSSLFERFNFKPSGSAPMKEKSSSRPQTPVSTKSTDAEMQDASTPPSSPPVRVEDVLGKGSGVAGRIESTTVSTSMAGMGHDDETTLPDLLDIQAFARKPLDKGQGKATTPDLETSPSKKPAPKRRVRVQLPSIQANRISLGSDDEDDLVIINPGKTKFDAILDRIPKNQGRESKSLRLQRQLAHLDSPERKAYKKIDKKAMTLGELQAQLQQRARDQAKLERERRMEMLKAKGIHIQTEEERQRDREAIEDMVARARREAEEIMDRERSEARAEKKARGDDPLAWDDSGSEDDEYEENEAAPDTGDEDETAAELSGSEEEDNAEAEGMIIDGDDEEDEEGQEEQAVKDGAEKTPTKTSALIDEAAGEGSDSENTCSDTEQSWVDPDEEEEMHRWGQDEDEAPAFVSARRPKQPLALIDDDNDMKVEATPKPPKTHSINFTPRPASARTMVDFTPCPKNSTSPSVPTSVLRSAAKTFIPGLPVDAGGPAGLGLTQIFAGTMDDSQAGPLDVSSPSQPRPTFEQFPDSQYSQNATDSTDGMVLDSQTMPATQDDTQIRLDFSQSQIHGLDSLLRDDLASQPSQYMEPTQDGGFQDWTPLKERFVEPPQSTVDTVIRNISEADEEMPHESPLMQKRSRIRRKAIITSDTEDEDEFDNSSKPSAFNVMKYAAAVEKKRKAREEFDKKKSKAKEMVHEQAEESEDEYAGLGGVDGEDSDDDGDDVKEMIDDQTQGNKDDELKISALHAERERAEDAKQTDKLFHDITRGMLRRKRGADYDLSDSDDGGEARRRMKRRQFAKMQKALFADERISKVAENPRNQAFMRTIEDIGSDEEMDFLFEPEPQPQPDSLGESQENNTTVPDSQPAATAAVGGSMAAPPKRAPANERRTKTDRRPATLGEIRETLSNLLDDPSSNTVISATDFSSASESEGEDSSSNKENALPRNPRRGGPVVDRISLKRQGSSNTSSTTGGGRMAFAAPSNSASNGGFKVPALLRKATTNSLISTGSSAAGSAPGNGSGGGFGDEAKIKKNAGKRSGISYLARETDRRAKMVEVEKRREERKFKMVEGRGKAVGGLFGKGTFE